jgi:hypothetical protein
VTGIELLDPGLPAGVTGGFTSRAGGVSAQPWDELNLATHVGDQARHALANRKLVARRLKTSWVSYPQQVHGAGVLILGDDQSGHRVVSSARASGADAIVTALPGAAIGILVADCLPVLLADPANGVVGAAHAGRRGLVAGVLQATVAAMAGLGADPATTEAVIGPAICGRCYEVPPEMRDEVDAAVPGAASETRTGTPSLDLPAGALGVLEAAGLAEAFACGICAAEDERFYSYRRDGVTGRFAGVIVLDSDG